ncbi:ErfK/YbiS/YcfS/YnhG family protein [Photobacterium swingsii]|uniref:L,D-transpeptidase family protein n=1 Tax=Photobacterium swingsii TaxID=680026 RepID=UPI0006620840|nr:L,D-transpeptidase family protein [Photobacterium swingsii]KMV30004.1 ErfK/YbiS/YcfS/YnhG family protein [Photobacterium swingsii]
MVLNRFLIGILFACTSWVCIANYSSSIYQDYPPHGQRTVADVRERYSPIIVPRLTRLFAASGVTYPPDKLGLFAIKEDAALELWAKQDGNWAYIKRYPVKKQSGELGPKLREGDKQVPEGVYRVVGLNPNSRFHLSMKLNYPNRFDLQHAQNEKRHKPGSNIFIHGRASSVGCLAMGDVAIEELFIAVESVGIENVDVVISPTDPRKGPLIAASDLPYWTTNLYRNIEEAAEKFGR